MQVEEHEYFYLVSVEIHPASYLYKRPCICNDRDVFRGVKGIHVELSFANFPIKDAN